MICAECSERNEELGRVAKPSVKLNSEKLSAQPTEVQTDESMVVLTIIFNVIVALLGGLIGIYVGSWELAIIGIIVAVGVVNAFLRLSI